DPVALQRQLIEPTIESAFHLRVRVRRKIGDDASVVIPPGLHPYAQDVWEVVEVMRGQDSTLLLGNGKQDRVVELFQIVDESGRDNVDAPLSQNANETVAGQIGIE